MTLFTLRSLLALAHGPACEGRTKEEIVKAFLPRFTCWMGDTFSDCQTTRYTWTLVNQTAHGAARADLTDPGTVGAVKVALALALGLDPGPLGASCSWDRDKMGYILTASFAMRTWSNEEYGFSGWFHAPEVAAEPDHVKALVLACEHVLREKA